MLDLVSGPSHEPHTSAKDAPLSILHVIESCGGSGVHLIDLCQGLSARGHASTIIYSPDRAEDSFVQAICNTPRVTPIALPMHRTVGLHDADDLKKLGAAIKAAGTFDVIHGHSSKAGALTRLMTRRIPGARVYTPHAYRTMDPQLRLPSRIVYSAIEFLLSWRCHKIIAGSAQEARVSAQMGIDRDKVATIPFGIAKPELRSRKELRDELELDQDQRVIGYVGRLVPQKAPERIVRALGAMKNKDAVLVMVGAGPLLADLEAITYASGLQNRIRFLGERQGRELMPAFDVFVAPSRYESLGYVYLEAAAAELPMVAPEVGIAPDVIAHDRNGFIVENTDEPAPWANALDKLLEDEKLASARRYAVEKKEVFSVDHMIDQIIDVYLEAIELNEREYDV